MTPLAELLPQAAPMVLLSGYEPPTEENAVEAFVDVTPQAPFFEPALGGVPSCVALEYMAQAMALCVGLLRRRKGLAPQVGFVLGSRRRRRGSSARRRPWRSNSRAAASLSTASRPA